MATATAVINVNIKIPVVKIKTIPPNRSDEDSGISPDCGAPAPLRIDRMRRKSNQTGKTGPARTGVALSRTSRRTENIGRKSIVTGNATGRSPRWKEGSLSASREIFPDGVWRGRIFPSRRVRFRFRTPPENISASSTRPRGRIVSPKAPSQKIREKKQTASSSREKETENRKNRTAVCPGLIANPQCSVLLKVFLLTSSNIFRFPDNASTLFSGFREERLLFLSGSGILYPGKGKQWS